MIERLKAILAGRYPGIDVTKLRVIDADHELRIQVNDCTVGVSKRRLGEGPQAFFDDLFGLLDRALPRSAPPEKAPEKAAPQKTTFRPGRRRVRLMHAWPCQASVS